jgi:prevent-host-death family protein
MDTVTISEAKSNFSALVKRARNGSTVTITVGRAKTPVARLSPIMPAKKKRLGALETSGFVLPAEFFEPLPEEELGFWNGEGE